MRRGSEEPRPFFSSLYLKDIKLYDRIKKNKDAASVAEQRKRKMRIILASKSPRRRELLGTLAREWGFEFEIITEPTDECLYAEAPETGVGTLAVRKGAAVAALHPDALIISSDTLVDLDGTPLGKPEDAREATEMLNQLSGRSHFVHTGIAVHYRGSVFSGVATTAVEFRALEEGEIREYVLSGEPMDKAGAYGIQGAAGAFVKGIDGEFDTVVGFNLTLLRRLMKEAAPVEFGGKDD